MLLFTPSFATVFMAPFMPFILMFATMYDIVINKIFNGKSFMSNIDMFAPHMVNSNVTNQDILFVSWMTVWMFFLFNFTINYYTTMMNQLYMLMVSVFMGCLSAISLYCTDYIIRKTNSEFIAIGYILLSVYLMININLRMTNNTSNSVETLSAQTSSGETDDNDDDSDSDSDSNMTGHCHRD